MIIIYRGVNEPKRTGTAFRLEFVRPEPRRSCSSVIIIENAVPPAEQKLAWIFRNAFR